MSVFGRLAGARQAPVARLGRSSMTSWFSGREPRERALIVIGIVMIAGYLAWIGVYQPLAAMRERALADITTYEAISARIKANGSNFAPAAARPAAAVPSATVITDSASAVGLIIRRLEPEGGRTWIEFDNADFSVLVGWLASLEKEHALKVATIELNRKTEPGVVSARISVTN